MPRLSSSDADQIRAIREELGTFHVGGGSTLDTVLPHLRALLGFDVMLTYRMREAERGWEFDVLHADLPEPERLFRRLKSFAAVAPPRFGRYDPLRPEPKQRNRVVDPTAGLSKDELQSLPMIREVNVPMGLGEHKQLRALICEGPSLLAWFGGLHPEPPDARQFRLLAAVVPAVRQRLSIERRLRAAPRVFSALDVALEMLGAPAFVLGRKGEIHETNAAAKVELERNARTLRAALRDAVARRPSAIKFEIMPLRESGADGYLAILQDMEEDTRLAQRVALASTKWGLSKRQRQVLELVVRGVANAVVAQSLRIAERTVEFHVTALFDRAGVESRAALAGAVLGM